MKTYIPRPHNSVEPQKAQLFNENLIQHFSESPALDAIQARNNARSMLLCIPTVADNIEGLRLWAARLAGNLDRAFLLHNAGAFG